MAVPKVDGQFIAEAIKYIDENGVPWHNTSTKYELVWDCHDKHLHFNEYKKFIISLNGCFDTHNR